MDGGSTGDRGPLIPEGSSDGNEMWAGEFDGGEEVEAAGEAAGGRVHGGGEAEGELDVSG